MGDRKAKIFTANSGIAIGMVIALAAVLRIFHLGAESLWIDEGFSLRDAREASLLGQSRPLYFLFLHQWIKIAGDSELLLRLPSALFGIAGVWVLYLIADKLAGRRVALLSALMMSISVLHINHSQEIRMYSLTALLVLLSTYMLIRALETKRGRYVLAYAVLGYASLLAFPLSILILASHGLFALLYLKAYRPVAFSLILAQFAVVAMWVPWLLINRQASDSYSGGYTAITLDKPTPDIIVKSLGRFFLWKWTDDDFMLSTISFAFSILVLGLAVYGAGRIRTRDSGEVLPWIWLAVPMLGLVALSYTVTNMWMVHYLIAASPALFILVSKGILSLKRTWLCVGLAAVVLLFTLARLGLYYVRPNHPEWHAVTAHIQANERAGDVIGIYYGGNQYVFDFHYHGISEWSPMGDDSYAEEDFEEWEEDQVRELISGFPLSGQRFWLVLSHHTYRGGFSIINYFTERYEVVDHKVYHLVEVYLFEGNHPLPRDLQERAGVSCSRG